MTEPLKAKSIAISFCEHGTVWIDLIDAEGKHFASAPMSPDVGRDVGLNLIDIYNAASAGARGESCGNRGRAH